MCSTLAQSPLDVLRFVGGMNWIREGEMMDESKARLFAELRLRLRRAIGLLSYSVSLEAPQSDEADDGLK